MSQPHRRPNLTALDMARGLIPLALLVLLVAWLNSPGDVDPVREIDPLPDLQYAATVADFPVLAPALPDGWQATSAAVEPPPEQGVAAGSPVTVRVGYLTPEERFAEVVQSADPNVRDTVLGGGWTADGRLEVGGTAWERVRTTDGEIGLVLTDGAATVIVTGSADVEELVLLAGALRPLPG